jgi:hypothetical protein
LQKGKPSIKFLIDGFAYLPGCGGVELGGVEMVSCGEDII